MDESAKKWQEDYVEGKKLFKKGDADSLQKAYELFSCSAKLFPDSFLAGECHLFRAKILEKMNKKNEAEEEFRRVKEYYMKIK
jgi:TolA-binding protein